MLWTTCGRVPGQRRHAAGWDVEYLGRPGRDCGLEGSAAANNGAPGRLKFGRPGTNFGRGQGTSTRCILCRR